MRLEDALRLNGYTIDRTTITAVSITTPEGVIKVPEMVGSKLTWRRDEPPFQSAAFYLDKIPVFAEAYRPLMLSNILDQFSTRRIGYDTLDAFGLAVRRWSNLNLGPNSIIYRRYLSAAVELPLNTVDMTQDATAHESTTGSATNDGTSTTNDTVNSNDSVNATSKSRNADSDFPQGVLAGSADYATAATDAVGTDTSTGTQNRTAEIGSVEHTAGTTNGSKDDTEHRTEVGRNGQTVMQLLSEQREAFINADQEFLTLMEPLFLGVFDRSESESFITQPPAGYGLSPFRW